MIKTVFWIITPFIFISCTQVNSVAEKTITNAEDTVGNVEIALSKVDQVTNLLEKIEEEPILLFKASGSEPGWYAEVYNNKLKLVIDYGKDSLIIEDTFSNLESEKGFIYNSTKKINEKQVAFSFLIKNTPCTSEASGEKEDRVVVAKLNGKEYKGCGSFVK